jgi:hypothetical protein
LVSYLLYVVLVASFLSFGGLAWATKNEEDIHFDVERGYSLLPGLIHLRGMKLRVKDYNIEMEVLADRADAFVWLWKLPFKQLHVPWVRVHGAEYKLVHRVIDPVLNAERLAAFPDIPGFDRPLHYDAPQVPADLSKFWSVRFDSIKADVRRAWILEYQFLGKVRAEGGFFLDPAREAVVWPCRVDMDAGEIFVRDQRVAHGVRGRLSAEVRSFHPREAMTEDVVPKLSAGVEVLSAELDTLSFSKLYVHTDRMDWDGKGQLRIDVRMRDGQIQEGSSAELSLSPITLRAGGTHVEGTGSMTLRAAVAGKLDAQASLSFPEQEQSAVSVEVLEGTLLLEHQIITSVSVRRASLITEKLRFKTPSFLRAAFRNSTVFPSSGAFDVQAFLDLPEQGNARFDAELLTRSTSFYLSGLQLGVTANGRMHCDGTRVSADCSLEVHAPYLLFDQKPGKGSSSVWLRANSREALKVSIEEGTLSGSLRLTGSDPKGLAEELIGEDWIAQLGLSLVPTGPLAGTFHVNRTPERFALNGDLSSGSSRVQGHFSNANATSGAWTVDMPAARWGFLLKADEVSSHPLVGSDWLASH